MKIVEQGLWSKNALAPDNGGEDRIIVTADFAAVIDGATAKTKSRYIYKNEEMPPGKIAAEILVQAVPKLDPEMNGHETCGFLNQCIYQTYQKYDIVDKAYNNASERFTAAVVLYSAKQNCVGLFGEGQAVINNHHYQLNRIVDQLHAEARSAHLVDLIQQQKLTLDDLANLAVDEDPGRQLILNPPPGSTFPGLVGQEIYQNNPHSNWGFFALDGFANTAVNGFKVIDVPAGTTEIILASDGFPIADGQDGAKVLRTLQAAEENRRMILSADPFLFNLYKSTKGPGTNISFDDRAYLRLALRSY